MVPLLANCVMVPPYKPLIEKDGLLENPAVNLRRSVVKEDGVSTVFFPIVMCGTDLKWRYSSRYVYPDGVPAGKKVPAVLAKTVL